MPINYRESRRAEAVRYFSEWRKAGAELRVDYAEAMYLTHGTVEVDFDINLSTLAVIYVDRRRKALRPAVVAGVETGSAKCSVCLCTVDLRHEPNSDDCRRSAEERSISQSDWNE
jgi:hypothetical protein